MAERRAKILNAPTHQSASLRSHGSDMEKSRAERIREIWAIRAHDVLSGSACEGKSRVHARVSLNSLKCPIIEDWLVDDAVRCEPLSKIKKTG